MRPYKVLSLCQFDCLCRRRAPNYLLQRLLKRQIVSMALCQRSLVEILQNQLHLAETYIVMKAKLSTNPSNCLSSIFVRQKFDLVSTPPSTPASTNATEADSCDQDSHRKQNYRVVTWAGQVRTAPNNAKNIKMPRPPAALPIQWGKTPTHTDELNDRTCQSSTSQSRNTSQDLNFKMKGSNVLIQASAEDKSRHLSKLIQMGVIPPGSSLQLLLKVGFSHKPNIRSLCNSLQSLVQVIFRIVT